MGHLEYPIIFQNLIDYYSAGRKQTRGTRGGEHQNLGGVEMGSKTKKKKFGNTGLDLTVDSRNLSYS